MLPFFYDPTFLLLIPAMVLALYAQFKVQSTFHKYSEVESRRGIRGMDLARAMLDANGLSQIEIEMSPGQLSDHYDPRVGKLRLSQDVAQSSSVAALGVAAHEVGHAIQHAKAYAPLVTRNSFIGVAQIGSTLSFPLFFIGLLASLPFLMDLGIIFFSAAVAFQVVTLPVELNASKRAMSLLEGGNYLAGEELGQARKVLNAAALTYIAAMAVALMNLLRLIILRNSRDD